MPVAAPAPITKGKKTLVKAALLPSGVRIEPNNVVFTTSAGAAKGATSISVTSVNTTLIAGQRLEFRDGLGLKYIAVVNANYTTGGSLTVLALPEAIPAGATAVFPVNFLLRTSADFSKSTDLETINTFDHSDNGDASPGASTTTVDLAGYYSAYDAGGSTLRYASNNNLEVYLSVTLDSPGTGFTTGLKRGGAFLITSVDNSSPNDGPVSADYSAQLVGTLNESEPVAV